MERPPAYYWTKRPAHRATRPSGSDPLLQPLFENIISTIQTVMSGERRDKGVRLIGDIPATTGESFPRVDPQGLGVGPEGANEVADRFTGLVD